ncbi:holin [Chania multitudinisentens RB-25]|uniref:Holin n=1 Tax=Chania multitudinisentens RB-25 TaxID=1441930 RepID=W0L4D5_9GAMM|nr:phage holin family protein [Chania multitudinisentens]AHG18633.1 holin [Chania multitudinisentens RB-25]
MELKIPNTESIFIWVIIGAFSAWGGFARYIIETKDRNIDWSWGDVLGQIVVSSFAGFLGGIISFESGVSLYMTFALSGLFGTMGSSGIDYLWRRLFNHGGKK